MKKLLAVLTLGATSVVLYKKNKHVKKAVNTVLLAGKEVLMKGIKKVREVVAQQTEKQERKQQLFWKK